MLLTFTRCVDGMYVDLRQTCSIGGCSLRLVSRAVMVDLKYSRA